MRDELLPADEARFPRGLLLGAFLGDLGGGAGRPFLPPLLLPRVRDATPPAPDSAPTDVSLFLLLLRLRCGRPPDLLRGLLLPRFSLVGSADLLRVLLRPRFGVLLPVGLDGVGLPVSCLLSTAPRLDAAKLSRWLRLCPVALPAEALRPRSWLAADVDLFLPAADVDLFLLAADADLFLPAADADLLRLPVDALRLGLRSFLAAGALDPLSSLSVTAASASDLLATEALRGLPRPRRLLGAG